MLFIQFIGVGLALMLSLVFIIKGILLNLKKEFKQAFIYTIGLIPLLAYIVYFFRYIF